MASDVIRNVSIKGIAAAVPTKVKRAQEYEDIIGKDGVKKFIDTVGIRERHIGDGKIMTSDLCLAAAEDLLARTGTDKNEIEGLLVVTQTGDYIAPATACVLQNRLGLSEHCMAYDIPMGCSGYLYGLYNAASHIQNGHIKKVLLLVGDCLSYMASPKDRGQMMLSGDAGTATLLEYDKDGTDMKFLFKTIGAGYKNLIVPYGGYKHKFGSREQRKREDGIIRSDYDTFMDGSEVFKFSISEVPKLFREFYKTHEYNIEECDYVVLHQANLFIMKNIARRLKISFEKVPVSLDRYGNTSSATIPLTLCDLFGSREAKKRDNNKIFISGFGVGLSLGAAALELDPRVCLPIIESDCCYEDHIDSLHNMASDFVERGGKDE